MTWILFVLINTSPALHMQEFNNAQACADAAVELEKRLVRMHPQTGFFDRKLNAWCMPKDKREKPKQAKRLM